MASNNKTNEQPNILQKGFREIDTKQLLYGFLAIVIASVIPFVVRIIDVIIVIIRGVNSSEKRGNESFEKLLTQDISQPMNLAYIMLVTYALYILIFGLWYRKSFRLNSASISSKTYLKHLFKSPTPYLLIVCGIAGQILVDSVLNLCHDLAPSAFAEYDALVSDTVGPTSSIPMLIAVFLLAPIGEELLFRGLLQGFLFRCCCLDTTSKADTTRKADSTKASDDTKKHQPPNKLPRKLIIIVILAQALCFGVYHGNLIQGIYAFLLGLILGLIAYKAKSIIPCIIFHMALNISILIIQPVWFEFTSNCIITGIISLVIFTASLFFTLKFIDRTISNSQESQ